MCLCRHERAPTIGGFLTLLQVLNSTDLTKNYDNHFRYQMTDCARYFQNDAEGARESIGGGDASGGEPSSFRVIRWSASGRGGGASLHDAIRDVCAERLAHGAFSRLLELCEQSFPPMSTSVHMTNTTRMKFESVIDDRVVDLARAVYARDFAAFYVLRRRPHVCSARAYQCAQYR
jgi:hypothetical protein